MDKFRPETFLPLTPVAFEILLALADGERHGYSILQEVEFRSGGAVSLHAGTLYRALARLLESDLIEELSESPLRLAALAQGRPTKEDERRRYYRLTARGIAVARAEASRLEGQVAAARARRLLKGARA
jgi:DNA-binding PadR family transcriptional regulator